MKGTPDDWTRLLEQQVQESIDLLKRRDPRYFMHTLEVRRELGTASLSERIALWWLHRAGYRGTR